jgi:hypothetical protein
MNDVTIETEDGYSLQVDTSDDVPPEIISIAGREYARASTTPAGRAWSYVRKP